MAFICELFFPYVKGGAENRYWEVSKRLAREHEVHVFTMRPEGTPTEETLEGIYIHRTNEFKNLYSQNGRRRIWPSVRFSCALLKQLFKGYGQFDVVDFSAFPYLPCLSAKILSVNWHAPLAVTFHEVWGSYWFEYFKNPLLARVGKFFECSTAQLANKIIAVSRWTALALSEVYKISQEKVTVIPNGVSLDFIRSVSKEKEPLKVLYVGRLIEHKHVDWLLTAMKTVLTSYPKASLHIIGDGPQRDFLESYAHELGIVDAVRFYGTLSSRLEVIEHMKSASVFVLPSTREGFSMVTLEAMAAGTPVVIMKAPLNAALDYVRDGQNGLVVEPNKPDAIAKAIMLLFEDSDLYLKLVQNGFSVAGLYNWDTIAGMLGKFYRSIAESN
ncbi:MAG: glycosyltransferase family 4 protein [Candidatus Bathyarchaeia archaeon]